jgi:hypothetical protein
MKLQELNHQKPVNRIEKVLESRLGRSVDFARVDARQARNMLTRVRAVISEVRRSPDFYRSERNPGYLRALMLEQALEAVVKEQDVPIDMENPKVKTAMDKLKRKQTLSPDEQQMVNTIATVQAKESKNLREQAELQTAQVVLASQDMIDRIQGMMEDVSEMQFKDLPALVSSIKQDMGTAQAGQFQTAASQSLAGLLQAIQGAKQQMETAQGAITGDTMEVPGELPAEPGQELPDGDTGAEGEPDLSLDANLDDVDAEPAVDLGRERR